MSINRQDVVDGAAWARRALRKPNPSVTEPKLTEAERRERWLEERKAERAVDGAGTTQTRAAVEQTRRDLHVPGTAYQVGQERFAADGSRWQRTG